MTPFLPILEQFFQGSLSIISWQVCILDWVSDKYCYLLKPCCNYSFQVSIIFGLLKKVINFALETSGKIQILIYPRTMNILFCKVSKFWNIFFFYLGFISRTFTNHRTAGKWAGYFFNSSVPLSPASQTLRH